MGRRQIKLRHILKQDEQFPDMWRVLKPTGELSDLLNLSRANILKREIDSEQIKSEVKGKLRERVERNPNKKKPRRPSC